MQVDEALAKAHQQFEMEREQMSSYLKQKIEVLMQKEMQLDDLKDAYRVLEQAMQPNDQKLREKLMLLEREILEIQSQYLEVLSKE